MTLDDLLTQLKSAHGSNLRGVVLYGSTAGDPAAKSGHDVLVVVSQLDLTSMQAAGAIARAWQASRNNVPLTLTEAEWRSSVDVFAIEHADIADRHRVLFAAGGFAPTPRASIRDADVRHQLEYEALALTLGVRSAIAAAGNDVKAQREIVSAQASHAVALMRAALRMSGRPVEPDGQGVCRTAGEIAGFDAEPFMAALRQRRGDGDIPKREIDSVVFGFHAGLAALVRWVDQHGKPAAHQ